MQETLKVLALFLLQTWGSNFIRTLLKLINPLTPKPAYKRAEGSCSCEKKNRNRLAKKSKLWHIHIPQINSIVQFYT